MVGIGRVQIVHEGIVMGRIGRDRLMNRVGGIGGIDTGMTDRGGAAHGLAGDYVGRCKAALEPTPGDALPIQQIADIVVVESAVGLEAGLTGAAAIVVNRV